MVDPQPPTPAPSADEPVQGTGEQDTLSAHVLSSTDPPRRTRDDYLAAVGTVAAASALGGLAVLAGASPELQAILYLVAVVLVASRTGLGAALFGAVLAVAAHAYFFLPPAFAFPTDVQGILTIAAYLVVAVVVGTLTARLRVYADLAERRALHSDVLREVARSLSRLERREAVLARAAREVGVALDGDGLVVLLCEPEDAGTAHGAGGEVPLSGADRDLARSSLLAHAVVASAGEDGTTVSHAAPMEAESGPAGAVRVRHRARAPFNVDSRRLLEALARLTGEALERLRLSEQAQRAAVETRTERLRTALLSSVSHDLRTPLAVILGATSHLAEQGESLGPVARQELSMSAAREADRLNRLVNNLLAMTRLDAGAVKARKDWQPLEDVIGAAVGRTELALAGRSVEIRLEPRLPLVPVDAVLVEQVLLNLLENAARHTPAGTAVEVAARRSGPNEVVVEVLDRGPGLRSGEEEAIFERFHQGAGNARSGVGLGLSVCRGIVTVHGGRIWAENRPGGGSAFRFTLPIEGAPPEMPVAELDGLGEAS